jgi:hypothetical protein
LKARNFTINEGAKTILSLDISCELLNIAFETASAVKHSSMRKRIYDNYRKTFLKLMKLDKKTSIRDLILKRGISNAKVDPTAHKIYEAYQNSTDGIDLDHPQYMAMSVFEACKLEGVKVSKKDFISISNLKPNQWTLLEKTFDKIANSVGKLGKENSNNKFPTDCDTNVTETKLKRKVEAEPEIEDYDVWAERTLKKAYAELEKILKI